MRISPVSTHGVIFLSLFVWNICLSKVPAQVPSWSWLITGNKLVEKYFPKIRAEIWPVTAINLYVILFRESSVYSLYWEREAGRVGGDLKYFPQIWTRGGVMINWSVNLQTCFPPIFPQLGQGRSWGSPGDHWDPLRTVRQDWGGREGHSAGSARSSGPELRVKLYLVGWGNIYWGRTGLVQSNKLREISEILLKVLNYFGKIPILYFERISFIRYLKVWDISL